MAAEEKKQKKQQKKKSRQTHRGSRRDGMPQLHIAFNPIHHVFQHFKSDRYYALIS